MMKHETADRRMQQRCVKDVSMTCAHLNQNDDRIVTVRNYSSTGLYFESDEEALIGSFVVIGRPGLTMWECLPHNPSTLFNLPLNSPTPELAGGIGRIRLPGLSAAIRLTTQPISASVLRY